MELDRSRHQSAGLFSSRETHPRAFKLPTPVETAVDVVETWLESPRLVLLGEGPAHFAALRRVLLAGKVVGPKVHDARIAALCLAHDVRELWSADRDFSRFPTLKVRNPL